MKTPRSLLWSIPAFAAIVVLFAPAVRAAPRAGVAAAVRGSVTLERPGSVGLAVETGAPVYIGDAITTGADSGLQILLLDETVFTIGPDSEMKIDEFVFDPDSSEGALNAELVRGAFRFISGRIAKKNPEKMKVELPAGTIGIRGTMVNAQVDPAQGRSLIVLAGPGEANAAGARIGQIRVRNAGVSRNVARSGWGIEIPDRSAPPSSPFQVTQAQLDAFRFEVASPRAPGPPRSRSRIGRPRAGPGAAAGLPLALAREGALLEGENIETSLRFKPLSREPSQLMTLEMQTTVDELLAVSSMFTGQFFYDQSDLLLESGNGSVDLAVTLDFNAQQVQVELAGFDSPTFATTSEGFASRSLSFSSGINGLASFLTSLQYDDGGNVCNSATPCTAGVRIDFGNDGGQTAGRITSGVRIRNQAGTLEERTVRTTSTLTAITTSPSGP